ncbi:thiamine pyrophosphate-binding protein [Candidimonas nitroreducens]|uniref:Decarboxylase n=1 Tax=Candidimonas nitroreducens TaxID=683354 RepID=A0A225MPN4_9BURK|nr:thiamine pyrophosphate-binding protein [Candidimonas nitroreducens]OWT61890.1 decarboxylase [Candidimonas nitroreducens]
MSKRWPEIVARTLKSRDVRLITYVPDKVLAPLIDELLRDDFFTVINPTREEEAVGLVAGAWMAGGRGIVLMQTSGFATIANALASLSLPYQIPVPMMISERGTLGEFQIGQFMVYRTMQPLLNTMNIESYRLESLDTLEMIVGRSLDQAYKTQAPAALLLNPLLTARSAEEL